MLILIINKEDYVVNAIGKNVNVTNVTNTNVTDVKTEEEEEEWDGQIYLC